jgi:hypothetical protein
MNFYIATGVLLIFVAWRGDRTRCKINERLDRLETESVEHGCKLLAYDEFTEEIETALNKHANAINALLVETHNHHAVRMNA